MKKTTVYIFSGIHPIYESLLKYPPEYVSYKSNVSFEDMDKMTIYKKSYEWKKNIALKVYYLLRIPRMMYFPQARNCDLIFSCRGVIPLNRKPWLIEIEHADSFGPIKKINHFLVEKMLASKNCKKIISRCKAVTNSLVSGYNCKEFEYKIEEVYPAVEPAPKFKKLKNQKLTLLFVSGYPSFYRKGGREVLEAFKILKKTYDIKLIIRGTVPEELKNKYIHKDILFIEKMIPHKKIYSELYSKADIFVLPTYFDGFGIVYLEAMAAGLPIVGTDVFAVPEIIDNGKNGFLIKSPISNFLPNGLHRDPGYSEEDIKNMDLISVVNQLVDKISLLIENPILRKKMGEHGKKLIEEGKFSIKERNKKLTKIYADALKN